MGNLKSRLDKLDDATKPLDRTGLVRVEPRLTLPPDPDAPEPVELWVDPAAPRLTIPLYDDRWEDGEPDPDASIDASMPDQAGPPIE